MCIGRGSGAGSGCGIGAELVRALLLEQRHHVIVELHVKEYGEEHRDEHRVYPCHIGDIELGRSTEMWNESTPAS